MIDLIADAYEIYNGGDWSKLSDFQSELLRWLLDG